MILWNYDIAFSFKDVFVCRYNDTFASIKSKTDRQLSVNVGFHESLFHGKLIGTKRNLQLRQTFKTFKKN